MKDSKSKSNLKKKYKNTTQHKKYKFQLLQLQNKIWISLCNKRHRQCKVHRIIQEVVRKFFHSHLFSLSRERFGSRTHVSSSNKNSVQPQVDHATDQPFDGEYYH